MSDIEPTLQEIETALDDSKDYLMTALQYTWLRWLLNRVKTLEAAVMNPTCEWLSNESCPVAYRQRDKLRAAEARVTELEAENRELMIAIRGECGCPAPYLDCPHDEPLFDAVNRLSQRARAAEGRVKSLEAALNAQVIDGERLSQITTEALAMHSEAEAENERLRSALRQSREALRLTREYIGEETLPAADGWAWFDAINIIDAVLAAAVSVESTEP